VRVKVHGVIIKRSDMERYEKARAVWAPLAALVLRSSTGRQYGPFGAITIDSRLPSVEIHIASDEASLLAATPGLS